MDAQAHSRSSVSFSLKHIQPKSNQAKRRVLIDGDTDEPETAASEDVPLGTKRKRDAPPPPKVIPLTSVTDWREERKRRLGILENHAPQLGSQSSLSVPQGPERAFDEPQKQGLVTVPSGQRRAYEREDTPPRSTIAPGDMTPPTNHNGLEDTTTSHSSAMPPTDDDAIRALLSNEPMGRGAQEKLVIEQPSEEDMFRHDVDSRPNEPSLRDYATMPVEEFGAAMLRGMGWKDGSGIGRNHKGPTHAPIVQRRAALLGLGAKERTMPSSSSRKAKDERYMPVVPRSEPNGPGNHTTKKEASSRSEHRYDRPSSSDRHDEAYRSSRHHHGHSRSSGYAERGSSHASRYDDRHRSHSHRHERGR